jgi:hypothetical protein
MIQRQTNLKMDELLFNMNYAFSESAFLISTVQNLGNI